MGTEQPDKRRRSQSEPNTYCSPKLQIYGAMTKLTAAGTGSQPENKGADDQTKRFP